MVNLAVSWLHRWSWQWIWKKRVLLNLVYMGTNFKITPSDLQVSISFFFFFCYFGCTLYLIWELLSWSAFVLESRILLNYWLSQKLKLRPRIELRISCSDTMLNYRLTQKLKLLEIGEFNHLTINLTNICTLNVWFCCCYINALYFT